MSQYDDYADDEELADFIVDDLPEESADTLRALPRMDKQPPRHEESSTSAENKTLKKLKDLGMRSNDQTTATARLLRAHVSVLVSALGGPDHAAETPVYKLGHDALACLKDLKRWLRAVDEKNGSFDVALACADCDLVKNDLTVILCQFDAPKTAAKTRGIDKIKLACLELLVLLTWPTDVDRNTLMKDFTAKTSNRRAQVVYKHHILAYKQGKTLKAVLRLGLAALKVPKDEREPRDINILRLILFFIRNVLYIEPLPITKGPKAVGNASALPGGISADEIALPAVLQAFERNNVLLFLNSIAHAVLTEINEESFGLLVMECVALLTRGVMTEELVLPRVYAPDLATNVPPASSVAGMGLLDLLGEEKRRKNHATNSISTRHGRFGTLLSLRNSSNASYFAVSGQKALASTYDTLQKLDTTKNWHKPANFKYDSNAYAKRASVLLGERAAAVLNRFVSQLLISGSFNNLLMFVARHLTNLANDRDAGAKGILDYDSLHVAMVCFREMLMISNSIFTRKRTQQEIELESEDDVNEDRELAEGIIRKLFSQKQFLDMCVNIPKTAAKHSPEYLAVVVSVVHILLKSFESLANEDVHLFIKTRRRMRKMEKAAGLNQEMDREHMHLIDRGSDEEDNEDEIRYITQERKLDLRNTEVKFFHPDTVSTHIEYLSKYEDLSSDEIKRALSFFHRLFVVRKDFSSLYRLDFMLLLYKLQAYLPRSSSNRRHVDDFIVYYMKKFKSALDRFPTAIELLFPRLEDLEIKGFLSTGDLKVYDSLSKKKVAGGKSSYFDEDATQPRAAPLKEFNDDSKSLDEKIGILVYTLVKKKNTTKFLKCLSSELLRIFESDNLENATIRLNLANRRILISDSNLRLLLETIGFGLPYLQNDETTLHASVTANTLREAKESLDKWVALHVEGVGDIEPFLDQMHHVILTEAELEFGVKSLSDLRAGKSFDEAKAAELGLNEIQIHRVIGLAERKEYDDKLAAGYYDAEFEEQSDSDEDAVPKETETRKRKRSRRQVESDDELSVSEDEAPSTRRRRGKRNLPRDVFSDDEDVTKSAERVHDSDDESDDERNRAFFEKEERLRQLISLTGGISSKEQLKMFKESWNAIQGLAGGHEIAQAVKTASGLFVDDLDLSILDLDDMDDDNEINASRLLVTPTNKESTTDKDDQQHQERIAEMPRRETPITQDYSSLMSSDEDDQIGSENEKERVFRKRRRVIEDDDDDE
ncbi:hypothetical protein HF325_000154 [Metschnikowia pulcherrima]|uniref:Topoisomerase 1-associated factor 1 n=1 Tax=Metschnikowia pulcherrima TaxID=27326 RepID=A0A8H7GXE9_9ASCO|nr:hypothetical protein HF325_000154 [Metschnikowia pulcherrima]